jgi:AraC-like DNA-binding protein
MNNSELQSIKPELYLINYLQCQKGFRTKERLLEKPYFLYVHKGKGLFIIGEVQYKCTAGDLFFCPYNVPNTIIADDSDPYLLSGVDFEFVKGISEFSPPTQFREHINIYDNAQFLWLTFELISRKATVDAGYTEYTQTLFKAWLLLVANLRNEDPRTSMAENIASYLLQNDARNMSLEEIGEEFKYHPNHINRVFKSKFGTTICQYHLELRIKKAIQFLMYSNYSVGEISNLCGYEDINYFSRIFKQIKGLSPSQYRNKYILHK